MAQSDIKLLHGDCLELMKDIPDKSVDLVLCDLPYNTAGLKWDCMIPLDLLWMQYKRIIKPNRAIVLFAQQPFTTAIISSNIEMWKYNWIWQKEMGSNFINCNYVPLKVSEDICVFGVGSTTFTKHGNSLIYNPQMSVGKPYICKNGNIADEEYAVLHRSSKVCGHITENNGTRYPTNILRFNRDRNKIHPTQKPVALLEYLIRTYSNENDLVLDNTMGSGSTGVAAINTNRRFIGIEKDDKYFGIAQSRINESLEQKQQNLFINGTE